MYSQDVRFYDVTYQGTDYSLPSVTSVIGKVLAKPELIGWTYRQTLESLAQLFEAVEDFDYTLLTDPDVLDQWLMVNRFRPEDLAAEAAERGRDAHRLLNYLAMTQLEFGAQDADDEAVHWSTRDYPEGKFWEAGVAEWWLERQPRVLATEQRVFKVVDGKGYAGTLDLMYETDNGLVVTLDLKTRKEQERWYSVRKEDWVTPEPPVYTSDEIQVEAYRAAYNWQVEQGLATSYSGVSRVLAVSGDGGYVEKNSTPQVFDDLLSIYYALGGKGGRKE